MKLRWVPYWREEDTLELSSCAAVPSWDEAVCHALNIPNRGDYPRSVPKEVVSLESSTVGRSLTLSLSDLRTSSFRSLMRPSLIAALVTDLKASSIRYLNASIFDLSNV